jgi:hypothetical protein
VLAGGEASMPPALSRVHLTLVAISLQLVAGASGPAVDNAWPERLDVMAFGSCSKPLWPQPLWDAVAQARPQLWLWTGDAVYLGRDQPDALPEAYQAQLANPGYRKLLAAAGRVDGVYDDHDLGENDAGRRYPHQRASQEAFLDFIGVSADSPRRARRGVFSAHTFGAAPHQIKARPPTPPPPRASPTHADQSPRGQRARSRHVARRR